MSKKKSEESEEKKGSGLTEAAGYELRMNTEYNEFKVFEGDVEIARNYSMSRG